MQFVCGFFSGLRITYIMWLAKSRQHFPCFSDTYKLFPTSDFSCFLNGCHVYLTYLYPVNIPNPGFVFLNMDGKVTIPYRSSPTVIVLYILTVTPVSRE